MKEFHIWVSEMENSIEDASEIKLGRVGVNKGGLEKSLYKAYMTVLDTYFEGEAPTTLQGINQLLDAMIVELIIPGGQHRGIRHVFEALQKIIGVK